MYSQGIICYAVKCFTDMFAYVVVFVYSTPVNAFLKKRQWNISLGHSGFSLGSIKGTERCEIGNTGKCQARDWSVTQRSSDLSKTSDRKV
jgi:hypothetical protein